MENTLNTSPKNTPREVFLHVLMIAALYASVISLIQLLLQYVDVLYPDALRFYYTGTVEQIRWSAAMLLVAFPLFLFLSRTLERSFQAAPELRQRPIRRWLIYLTLALGGITIAVDLVTLVYNFLGGDLTVPFVLKVLAVLVVTGAAFAYYLWEIKRSDAPTSVPRLAASLSAGFIILAVACSFFVLGSPQYQRSRRFDERRVGDLQIIQSEIIEYWRQKQRLPETLEMLTDDVRGFRAPRDPETDQPYEYRIAGALAFELCATFQTESNTSPNRNSRFAPPYPVPAYDARSDAPENWKHAQGRACFTRTIDPERYPSAKPQPN